MASGGCLCGALRYTAHNQLDSATTEYCHCRRCQKASGAPVMVFTVCKPEEFKWTKGSPKDYQSSEVCLRQFCGDCGCLMTFVVKEWDKMGFATPTLDEPEAVRPTEHIFCSSQLKWFPLKDELPHYPEANW